MKAPNLHVLVVGKVDCDALADLLQSVPGKALVRSLAPDPAEAPPVAQINYLKPDSLPLNSFHLVIGDASSRDVMESMRPGALIANSPIEALRKLQGLDVSSPGGQPVNSPVSVSHPVSSLVKGLSQTRAQAFVDLNLAHRLVHARQPLVAFEHANGKRHVPHPQPRMPESVGVVRGPAEPAA